MTLILVVWALYQERLHCLSIPGQHERITCLSKFSIQTAILVLIILFTLLYLVLFIQIEAHQFVFNFVTVFLGGYIEELVVIGIEGEGLYGCLGVLRKILLCKCLSRCYVSNDQVALWLFSRVLWNSGYLIFKQAKVLQSTLLVSVHALDAEHIWKVINDDFVHRVSAHNVFPAWSCLETRACLHMAINELGNVIESVGSWIVSAWNCRWIFCQLGQILQI